MSGIDAMTEQEQIDAIRASGYMPIDAALLVCHFIGKELQGVPSQYRKLAIARLRNKVRVLEDSGISNELAEMVEALCSSWETFE